MLPEMTKDCARHITDQIKKSAGDLAELLYKAHEGKAWKALGYDTWNDYTKSEFQISKSRTFELIKFVEVKRVIEKSAIADFATPTHESQTRPLSKVPSDKQPEVWKEAVEIAGGNQPTAKQVEEAVMRSEEHSESQDDSQPTKSKRVTYKPADGMQYAEMAIANLVHARVMPQQSYRCLARQFPSSARRSHIAGAVSGICSSAISLPAIA